MNLKSVATVVFLGFSIVACSQITNKLSSNLAVKDAGISKAPSIEFLSRKNGSVSILDESYEMYFSILQEREIDVLTGIKPPSGNIEGARDFAREKFASAVIDFTADEKACISFVIKEVNQVLNQNELNVVVNQPWKLIKIEDWLCGGFAHTRGDFIILSQKHLDKLTSKWSDNMTEADQKQVVIGLGRLLVHEQFHCLQRTYKSMFDTLYTDSWGFKKVNVQPEEFITTNQLSNPDAPIPEWAFMSKGNYYWIRTLIKEDVENPQMGADFMELIFLLNQEQDKFYVTKDANGKIETFTLSQFPDYQNRFPVTRGLDHPNEISAYMFSDYFNSLVNGSNLFEDSSKEAKLNSEKFIFWVKNYLH